LRLIPLTGRDFLEDIEVAIRLLRLTKGFRDFRMIGMFTTQSHRSLEATLESKALMWILRKTYVEFAVPGRVLQVLRETSIST
jgi:hypothetical protein